MEGEGYVIHFSISSYGKILYHSLLTPVWYDSSQSSQHGGPIFGNISNLKRGSQDQGTADRKAGFAEQTGAKPGVLGSLWNKYVDWGGLRDVYRRVANFLVCSITTGSK